MSAGCGGSPIIASVDHFGVTVYTTPIVNQGATPMTIFLIWIACSVLAVAIAGGAKLGVTQKQLDAEYDLQYRQLNGLA